MTRRAVIGIGNPLRGDDGVGRAVAAQLRGTLPACVRIVETDGEATALVGLLDGVESAVLIDACVSDAPVGTIRRFDLARGEVPPPARAVSSHGMGLAEALALARALGQLPAHCIVYAVEGRSFEPGAGLSAPLAAAASRLAARLRAELAQRVEP